MRHMMKREKSFYTAELSDLCHCHNWREVIAGWLAGYRLMSRIKYGALLMRLADKSLDDMLFAMTRDAILRKITQAIMIPEEFLAEGESSSLSSAKVRDVEYQKWRNAVLGHRGEPYDL